MNEILHKKVIIDKVVLVSLKVLDSLFLLYG